jgi:hypothetical protein
MSRDARCAHCPLPIEPFCAGEGARRVCDLVDPAHPSHRPGYRRSIERAARPRSEEEPPEVLYNRLEEARRRWESLSPAERASCCG